MVSGLRKASGEVTGLRKASAKVAGLRKFLRTESSKVPSCSRGFTGHQVLPRLRGTNPDSNFKCLVSNLWGQLDVSRKRTDPLLILTFRYCIFSSSIFPYTCNINYTFILHYSMFTVSYTSCRKRAMVVIQSIF